MGGELLNKSNYSDIIASEVQGSAYKDISSGFNAALPQPLAPIGTPAGSNGSQPDKQFHTAKYVFSSAKYSQRIFRPSEMLMRVVFVYFYRSHETTPGGGVSAGGADLEQGLMFESKKNAENVTSSPLNSWGSGQINQQVFFFVRCCSLQ